MAQPRSAQPRSAQALLRGLGPLKRKRTLGTPIGLLLAVGAAMLGCTPDEAAPRVAAESAALATHPQARVAFELVEDLKTSTGVLPPRPPGVPDAALWNLEGVIPPQCYTRTEGNFNPCYVCHQNQDPLEGRENQIFDRGLQREYAFSDFGLENHWLNLFEDRSERIAAISDAEIDAYIEVDNYSELDERLEAAGFRGWIPDLENLALGAAAFDDEGFALDGSWWVAFSYKPLPSTFWPTNGSTDDVMIRLPARFYHAATGAASREVYKANLAILEAAIKGVDAIGSLPIDESAVGEDVDGDGALGLARRVLRPQSYLGQAGGDAVVTHLYPEGTEFLHTVRYVGVNDQGETYPTPRMKEVRYMLKKTFKSKALLGTLYDQEFQEKFEGNLPDYLSVGDNGIDNKMGWWVNGFIEGFDGRLRWTTYEEKFFCMGCHNTVGTTIDKTFAFPRKVDGARGWRYLDLKGMPDAPSRGTSDGEILTYLRRVGGGVEFRNNPEMEGRFYRDDGSLDEARVRAAADVHDLIAPSRQRARLLNKAYRVIVEDQDYIFGRDATPIPPANVFDRVDPETAPTLPLERRFKSDLLLDWGASPAPDPASPEPCPDRSLRCGPSCVAPQSSVLHCGGCNRPCSAGQVCSEGTCACPAELAACGEQCVDLSRSDEHCGKCGARCPPGEPCTAGQCRPVEDTAESGESGALERSRQSLLEENVELRARVSSLSSELSACRLAEDPQ